jgi:hypothetical protein
VTGLVIGALTSVLQKYLGAPWGSLVNSASPWLAGMFALGTMWRRASAAAVAGCTVGVLELVGYYATAHLRGYPVSHSILLFWGVCALVGGPLFGAAGWEWWRGPTRLRGLGAAAMSSAFVAEAIVVYGIRLHYGSEAVLFAVVGASLAVVLGFRHRQHRRLAAWLIITLPAGALAELILELLYNQSL